MTNELPRGILTIRGDHTPAEIAQIKRTATEHGFDFEYNPPKHTRRQKGIRGLIGCLIILSLFPVWAATDSGGPWWAGAYIGVLVGVLCAEADLTYYWVFYLIPKRRH